MGFFGCQHTLLYFFHFLSIVRCGWIKRKAVKLVVLCSMTATQQKASKSATKLLSSEDLASAAVPPSGDVFEEEMFFDVGSPSRYISIPPKCSLKGTVSEWSAHTLFRLTVVLIARWHSFASFVLGKWRICLIVHSFIYLDRFCPITCNSQ